MSHTPPDDRALLTELEVLARRAGLAIPEERKATLLKAYKDLERMTVLMRQSRTAADEPAGTYDIRTVTRGL